MKRRFCPRCHHEIVLPGFVKSGQIKVTGAGKITIGCGNCKKGKIRLTVADLPVAAEAAA